MVRRSQRRPAAKPGRRSEDGLAEVPVRGEEPNAAYAAQSAGADAQFSKHLIQADPLVIEARQAYAGKLTGGLAI